MKTFDTFDGVTGMAGCRKKPIVVHADFMLNSKKS